MVGTLVFISDYLGEVPAFMTEQSDLWDPIDTLEQLKNSSMRHLVVKGFYEENLFTKDTVMEMKKMYVPQNENEPAWYIYYDKPLERVLENPRDYVIIRSGQC